MDSGAGSISSPAGTIASGAACREPFCQAAIRAWKSPALAALAANAHVANERRRRNFVSGDAVMYKARMYVRCSARRGEKCARRNPTIPLVSELTVVLVEKSWQSAEGFPVVAVITLLA